MGKKFILYGLSGLCTQVLWTGLGSLMKGDLKLSAFTYIWMFPIYGLAVFLEPVHDRIRGLPVIIRGGVYAILIISTAYLTGCQLKILLGARPWLHTKSTSLSINGVIRL